MKKSMSTSSFLCFQAIKDLKSILKNSDIIHLGDSSSIGNIQLSQGGVIRTPSSLSGVFHSSLRNFENSSDYIDTTYSTLEYFKEDEGTKELSVLSFGDLITCFIWNVEGCVSEDDFLSFSS